MIINSTNKCGRGSYALHMHADNVQHNNFSYKFKIMKRTSTKLIVETKTVQYMHDIELQKEKGHKQEN